MNKNYQNPNEFPYEKFIQNSLEQYFKNLGFEIKEDKAINLIAIKDDIIWIIEAKGITSSVGTDFDTCLGQLVKRMVSDKYLYGIALPKHMKYFKQLIQISRYFRCLTSLHIFLVNKDSSVEIIYPNDDIEYVKFEK